MVNPSPFSPRACHHINVDLMAAVDGMAISKNTSLTKNQNA